MENINSSKEISKVYQVFLETSDSVMYDINRSKLKYFNNLSNAKEYAKSLLEKLHKINIDYINFTADYPSEIDARLTTDNYSKVVIQVIAVN